MESLEQASTAIHGRAFEYRKEPYKCIDAKVLISRKLVITTLTRTLVLVHSDLKELFIKSEPVIKVLTKRDIKKKIKVVQKQIEVEEGTEQPVIHYRHWTTDEDSILQSKVDGLIKISYRELARKWNRTTASVSQRAHIVKHKTKQTGEAEEILMKAREVLRNIPEPYTFVPTQEEPNIHG